MYDALPTPCELEPLYLLVRTHRQIKGDRIPMQGPKPSGFFIYAKDPVKVAAFYESVLGMRRAHETDDMVVLDSYGLQIVIHAIPADVAATIIIADPPAARTNAALKFFFTVPSVSVARDLAKKLGGVVLETQYEGKGFLVSNAVDPEGNIFHLRENAP